MFALVESAFRVVDMGKVIIERRRSLPDEHTRLPDRLKKEIRESFPILDTDHDGYVTKNQVEKLVWKIDPDMTEEEMLDLLETADLDGDGYYDIEEYVFLMYLKWNDQESVQDIKEAFRVFDKDNSGALSREEFAFILKKLGEPLLDNEVDDILDHFDRDGSGEIDFDEFAYVMTGPHIDDESCIGTQGIPLDATLNLDQMNPLKRIIATSISRTSSLKKTRSPSIVRRASASKQQKDAGKGDTESTGKKVKRVSSRSDKRPLIANGPLSSSFKRPLTADSRPKIIPKKPTEKTLDNDGNDGYTNQRCKTPILTSRSSPKTKGDRTSMDSDNFSMCSDVIRHMNDPQSCYDY